MAIALRQSLVVGPTTTNSLQSPASTSWPQGNPLATSLLVAHVGLTAAQQTITVADNVNGSWNQDVYLNTASLLTGAIFSFTGPSNSSTTVTATIGASASTRMIIEEWTYDNNWVGSGAGASLDQTQSKVNTGGSSTPNTNATGTTAQNIELAVEMVIESSTHTIAAAGSWNLDITDSTPRLGSAYQLLSSTGTVSGSFTLGASAAWICCVATYKTGTAATTYTLSAQTTASSQSTTPPSVVYIL